VANIIFQGGKQKMLSGKKTYITAVILALGVLARAMGWLTEEQYEIIMGLMGSLGLATLRAGVAKSVE